MPVEVANDWRLWLAGVATALGLSGIAGALRAWARQAQIEVRVSKLEESAAQAQSTHEAVIGLQRDLEDLEGRLVRGYDRTAERLDKIETLLDRQAGDIQTILRAQAVAAAARSGDGP